MTQVDHGAGRAPVPPVPTAAATSAVVPVDATPSLTGAVGPTIHRDPVTTLDGQVVGYVISVAPTTPVIPTQRPPAGEAAPAEAHDHYLALHLPDVVADRYAFLPATPAMLDGHLPVPTVPGRLVLELPPGYEDRPDAAERATVLRALGADLALTGYRGLPAQDALLPHVGYAVVDRVGTALPLALLVYRLHTAKVRALAPDVHDAATVEECRAAKVDALYGGHAIRTEAPPAPPARVLRAGELQCLALLHLLQQPEVDLAEVAQVVDTDPVLTLRLLHLVNSGAFALASEVDTTQQAVVLLGTREVTTLVSALLLDARPDAMDSLWFILARALTCETLAGDGAAYTVGMLSALAAQLALPVELILDKVGVSATVRAAVKGEGELGAVLRAVRAHERKDSSGVLEAGLLPAEVSAAYMRCLADALATARAVTPEQAAA